MTGPFHYPPETIRIQIQIIPYYNKRGTDMIQNWFSSHQKIDPVAGGKAPHSKGNLGIVLTKPCLNFQENTVETPCVISHI